MDLLESWGGEGRSENFPTICGGGRGLNFEKIREMTTARQSSRPTAPLGKGNFSRTPVARNAWVRPQKSVDQRPAILRRIGQSGEDGEETKQTRVNKGIKRVDFLLFPGE